MIAKRLGGAVLGLALALLWLWDIGAIAFSPYASGGVRIALALGFALAVPASFAWLRRRRGTSNLRAAVFVLALLAVPLAAWLALPRPSNERNWAVDQQRLPRIERDGDRVTVRNVRNFAYRSTTDFDPRWEDRTYDLDRIESAWFVVEPFSSFPGAAHTFLSFGFAGGEYLAVSVEIRKEVGESFSALKGLYRNYEVMYVLGDERDLVQLRTEHRRDTVYVYPLRGGPEVARAMLVDVFARVEALHGAPEFYNSLTNTCTTNIVRHANRIAPGLVPLSWQEVLPGHSDARALELGLIDFDGTIEAARERFRVNDRAAEAAGAGDFSERVRRIPGQPEGRRSRGRSRRRRRGTMIVAGAGRRSR